MTCNNHGQCGTVVKGSLHAEIRAQQQRKSAHSVATRSKSAHHCRANAIARLLVEDALDGDGLVNCAFSRLSCLLSWAHSTPASMLDTAMAKAVCFHPPAPTPAAARRCCCLEVLWVYIAGHSGRCAGWQDTAKVGAAFSRSS